MYRNGLRALKKKERIEKIVQILKETNGASVKDLAGQLNVTEMTIRRDLLLLQENHVVRVVYGAAIYNASHDENDNGYDLFTAKDKRAVDKNKLGKKAALMIQKNDVIIVDVGTTTNNIIKYIPSDLPITVVCFTMNVLLELRKKPNINIILTGGRYHPDTQMFESSEGVALINRTRANKAFISAGGVNSQLGVTCSNHYEVETKKAALQSSLSKILVMDAGKFDKVKPAYFSEIDAYNHIITTKDINKEWMDKITEKGITLHTV